MAKYKGNVPNGQLAALLKSPRLSAATMARGRSIVAKYKSIVPVRTGLLRSKVYTKAVIGGAGHDRLVCRVSATAPYAASLEFGYTDRRGRRVPGGHYMKRAAGVGE